MKNYYYFPSTFFGFVGRGYGRRKACGYGYLVAAGYGGSVDAVPLTQRIKEKLLGIKDRLMLRKSEIKGIPIMLGQKVKQLWEYLKGKFKGFDGKYGPFNPNLKYNSGSMRNSGRIFPWSQEARVNYPTKLLGKSGSGIRGMGRGRLRKGSLEAKLYMARLRAMRRR